MFDQARVLQEPLVLEAARVGPVGPLVEHHLSVGDDHAGALEELEAPDVRVFHHDADGGGRRGDAQGLVVDRKEGRAVVLEGCG